MIIICFWKENIFEYADTQNKFSLMLNSWSVFGFDPFSVLACDCSMPTTSLSSSGCQVNLLLKMGRVANNGKLGLFCSASYV